MRRCSSLLLRSSSLHHSVTCRTAPALLTSLTSHSLKLTPPQFSSCSSTRSFHSSLPRRADAAPAEAAAEGEAAPPVKTDQKEILDFLTKLKLQDHAEKFNSFDHLLHIRSFELKAFGLTVKQRKSLLHLIDRYKVNIRVRAANQYIYANAHKLSPTDLQQGVYKIIYAHMYQRLDWIDNNVIAEKEWHTKVDTSFRQRKLEHNLLRGLREPEIMEMMKLEAGLIQFELDEMREKAAAEEAAAKEAAEAKKKEAEEAGAKAKSQADKINAVKDEEVVETTATETKPAADAKPAEEKKA